MPPFPPLRVELHRASQGLGELLEERDVQLQELTSARRDREKLRLKLADLEAGELESQALIEKGFACKAEAEALRSRSKFTRSYI